MNQVQPKAILKADGKEQTKKSEGTAAQKNQVNYNNSGSKPEPSGSGSSDYLRVVVRVRPPLNRELLPDGKFVSTVSLRGALKMNEDYVEQIQTAKNAISIYEYFNIESLDPDKMQEYFRNESLYALHSFTFDYVFGDKSNQVEVYENTAKPAVMSVLEGYNATVFAYGQVAKSNYFFDNSSKNKQTGTGKTYTMEGYKSIKDGARGIIPRTVEDIYKRIEEWNSQKVPIYFPELISLSLPK
jgi:Kinesin motor domain